MLTVLAGGMIVLGLMFFAIGTVGILRLPDFFTRLHATGKCDTLGALLLLGGLAIHAGPSLTAVKILAIVAFIFLANPTATHAFARAALRAGVKPWMAGEDHR